MSARLTRPKEASSRPREFILRKFPRIDEGSYFERQMPRYSFCRIVLIFLFFLSASLTLAAEAHAVFTLSVTPRRGGQHIRFEGGKPGAYLRNEEVTLTVTSDRGAQYRISQTVYQPLTNEFGNTIPQGAFIVFSPSNPLGTLRTQLETPITMGQVSIYTSNTAGDTDSFVLVFNVKVPEDQPGGVYHTQMTFTAELVNAQSGVSPSIVTMDVRVEITPDFRIAIQNVRGGRYLEFERISKDRPTGSSALKIEIESNIGTKYRIIQQLTEPLVSSEGFSLDESRLSFVSSGGARAQEVSESPEVIYTSSETGQGDVIQLQYQLTPGESQKAGIYSGNISFKIESDSPFVPSEVIHIPVKIEIETLFYLDMEMEQSAMALNFGVFKSGEEKQERRVILTVHSNLGQPYQVSQIVPRKLTNEEGTVIPREHFQFFGSEAQTGILVVMSPTPVQEGETVVFTSDNRGTPEKFVLNYSLTIPYGARAGTYNSEVKYSITTL